MMSSTKGSYAPVDQNEASNGGLGVSLTAPDPEDVAKPANAVPMIEIVAPATLMEGYQLQTQIGDQTMTVVIPPGGVERGQKFSVPMPAAATVGVTTGGRRRFQIPVGHWKDGLCDCCNAGCCHPSCLWSFICFLCPSYNLMCCWWASCSAVGASQVASRLKLNWLGLSTNDNNNSKTSAFAGFLMCTLIAVGMQIFLFTIFVGLCADGDCDESVDFSYDSTSGGGSSTSYHQHVHSAHFNPEKSAEANLVYMLWTSVGFVYLVFCLIVIYNVRSQVRKKFSIPNNENCPSGSCEDAYYAVCCPCCTSAQMMRHTGDYDHYPPSCCSKTGFPEWVNQEMVV